MGYPAKALFREEYNIKGFIGDFGVGRGNSGFLTMTFKENITDKKEAVKAWNNLRTQLTKVLSLFHYICVWERQERGAWHLHVLFSCPGMGSMQKFRFLIRDILSRINTGFGFFQVKWTKGNSKSIGNYMFKYLTKECREKYIRYVNYSRNFVRCCSSQFMFVGGKAGLWRSACRVLDEMFPDTFKFFYRHAGYDYLLSVVNGCQGDTQSFFNGLRDMDLFYRRVVAYDYNFKFKIQLSEYMKSCIDSFNDLYPVGQLKLHLQGGHDGCFRL